MYNSGVTSTDFVAVAPRVYYMYVDQAKLSVTNLDHELQIEWQLYIDR